MKFRVTDLMGNVLPDDPDLPGCQEPTEPPECYDDTQEEDCELYTGEEKCPAQSLCTPPSQLTEARAVTDLALLQQQLERTLAELR